MNDKTSFETSLLMWLGWISVVLAILGMLAGLADPIALILSCVALVLGGVSTLGGSTRMGKVVGGIVALNIVVVAYMHSAATSSNTPLLIFIAVMFAPAYLIVYALSQLGKWRQRNAAPLPSESEEPEEESPEPPPQKALSQRR